jgi:hypothetical protein
VSGAEKSILFACTKTGCSLVLPVKAEPVQHSLSAVGPNGSDSYLSFKAQVSGKISFSHIAGGGRLLHRRGGVLNMVTVPEDR